MRFGSVLYIWLVFGINRKPNRFERSEIDRPKTKRKYRLRNQTKPVTDLDGFTALN
ncbi:hypothetical protein HanXRQr2_Chr04g0146151 [Helianthus annuus]|uniref:Uncharacterized protein n=1 Tax=Helianthus annuus TaxID=4232 RepID=A0A9K3NQT4_HELAN|nr:hypothetical protein HanXRQr2_Chr04g0146151 [Helianthus annuus]